jgi:hypothetical protein
MTGRRRCAGRPGRAAIHVNRSLPQLLQLGAVAEGVSEHEPVDPGPAVVARHICQILQQQAELLGRSLLPVPAQLR